MLFVWSAELIQKHPADFFGFKVNWWVSAIPMWVANYNPPLVSYFLAGVASLFGWNEMVLHLAGLTVAFLAALGIYALAQMWCQRPLLATLVAIFTPAFLVSSTTLMSDVLMLAFWIWALVFWERALRNGQNGWQFIGPGILVGLALLTKYSAITLLPLLPVLSYLRTRKPGWWLLGLAVPVLMLAGYEVITARMYGRGLFSAAIHYAHTSHVGFPGGWKASGIIGLAFAGGSLLPLLFFVPFLWRPRTLWAGGGVTLGLWLALFPLWDNLGLMANGSDAQYTKNWYYLLQVALLVAGGLHLLLLTAAEARRKRDVNTVILVLWIVSGLLFATVLNWTVNARSFLPMVPAAAILLVRRLDAGRGNSTTGRWLWPLIPAAGIAMSIVVADYQLANLARTVAQKFAAKYKSVGHTVWFEGHGAFQYYMEKLGGQPIDFTQSLMQPGDIVIVPWLGGSFAPLPDGGVGYVEELTASPFSWVNLMFGDKHGAAGFYGANLGPVPFAIGKLPPQVYFVLKVCFRVQYHSQPANAREAQAGDVPSLSKLSYAMQVNPWFRWTPEAAKQYQLACQLAAAGKDEAAIQCYREMLDVDANNYFALNNLAYILTTASKPELRNGGAAVQLAMKAVELTGHSQLPCIETLAAAYAEAGQFEQACQTAKIAQRLALLTDQKETAARNAKLYILYASGKTANAAPDP